jgi:hypothetical protein
MDTETTAEWNENLVRHLRRLQAESYRHHEVAIARQTRLHPEGNYLNPREAAYDAYVGAMETVETNRENTALQPEGV